MSGPTFPYFLIFVAFFAISSWAMAIQEKNDGFDIEYKITSNGSVNFYQIYCYPHNNPIPIYPKIVKAETKEGTYVWMRGFIFLSKYEGFRAGDGFAGDGDYCTKSRGMSVASEYLYLNITCDKNNNRILIHMECQDCSDKMVYCPHPPPEKTKSID